MEIIDCKGCNLKYRRCGYYKNLEFINTITTDCPCCICLIKLSCNRFCSKRFLWSRHIASPIYWTITNYKIPKVSKW